MFDLMCHDSLSFDFISILVRSFLTTIAISPPVDVAPTAICAAAAMQIGHIAYSYDVLSTTIWFSSFARRRNFIASGSRRSRPS
jgi:hypothetical protein